MKILVADDDAVSRRLLETTLERAGFDVVVAADGTTAASILTAEEGPRLALLDWMMPGMDGEAVRAELRADPRTASIPVVVVTASPQLGGHAPADGTTLVKPFDADELLHVVGEHHGRSWPP